MQEKTEEIQQGFKENMEKADNLKELIAEAEESQEESKRMRAELKRLFFIP